MEELQANKLISILIEDGLLAEFERSASAWLGYDITFEIKKAYSWSGHVVSLEETGNATAHNLCSSPLTKMMFDNAQVDVRLCYEEDVNVYFTAHVSYHHTQGGSNGIDLFCAKYLIDKGELKRRW